MARSRQYGFDPREERSQRNNDLQSRERDTGQYDQQGRYGRDQQEGDRPRHGYGQGSGEDEFAQSRLLDEESGQDYSRGYGASGPRRSSNQSDDRDVSDRGYGGQAYAGQNYGTQSYGNRQSEFSSRNRFAGDYGQQRRTDESEERGLMERAGDEISSWFGDNDAQRRRENDHRGKGPKGYTRSDDRIRDDVNDHLSDDSWLDASDIEVSVNQGEVTLSGHVDSRQSKRRAEDCADRIAGVKHVQNNLRVKSANSSRANPGEDGAGLMSGKASGEGNTQA